MIVAAPASADHDTYGAADYGYGSGLVSDLETPLAVPGSQETAAIAPRGGTDADIASPGFRRLDQRPVIVRKKRVAEGSDLAFRGKTMVAGTYEGAASSSERRARPSRSPSTVVRPPRAT